MASSGTQFRELFYPTQEWRSPQRGLETLVWPVLPASPGREEGPRQHLEAGQASSDWAPARALTVPGPRPPPSSVRQAPGAGPAGGAEVSLPLQSPRASQGGDRTPGRQARAGRRPRQSPRLACHCRAEQVREALHGAWDRPWGRAGTSHTAQRLPPRAGACPGLRPRARCLRQGRQAGGRPPGAAP